jgi:hypothetical protein
MAHEFKNIESSNLEAASYDTATKILVVRFKSGRAYKYFDVSPELYADFETLFDGTAGSAGSFFSKQIRFIKNEQIEDWK